MTLQQQILVNGCMEIRSGVYLNSRDYMFTEQESWFDNDQCKDFDFSRYEYWITDNDGMLPDGYDTVKEALMKIFDVEE
jgi:hypothetical protein